MRTAGKEPKYVRLANLLEDIIRNCSFRPGDRVPSVRQFSSQHGVSIPTALQAYVTLETRGLIEARPRSGYYVRARQADFLPDPSSAAVGLRTTNFTQTYPIESVLLSEESAKLIPLGAAL